MLTGLDWIEIAALLLIGLSHHCCLRLPARIGFNAEILAGVTVWITFRTVHVCVAARVQHQWYLMVELEELNVVALVYLKMALPGEVEVVPEKGEERMLQMRWENQQLKYEILLPDLDN